MSAHNGAAEHGRAVSIRSASSVKIPRLDRQVGSQLCRLRRSCPRLSIAPEATDDGVADLEHGVASRLVRIGQDEVVEAQAQDPQRLVFEGLYLSAEQ